MISFLPTEYNTDYIKFVGYDIIGIFKGPNLIKTKYIKDAKKFIELKKQPKSIRGAQILISRFNNEESLKIEN